MQSRTRGGEAPKLKKKVFPSTGVKFNNKKFKFDQFASKKSSDIPTEKSDHENISQKIEHLSTTTKKPKKKTSTTTTTSNHDNKRILEMLRSSSSSSDDEIIKSSEKTAVEIHQPTDSSPNRQDQLKSSDVPAVNNFYYFFLIL